MTSSNIWTAPGAQNWVLVLTADHGAPPAPEDAGRFGIRHARRIGEAEVLGAIASIRSAAGPAGNTAAAAEAARALDIVDRVIVVDALADPSDPLERLYAHSYRPGRVSRHPFYENAEGEGVAEYGIIPVPPPHAVVDWATSIHGSPYRYDREVPLLFYGPGIPAGSSPERARTIDAAPTLAALLGIVPLGEVDGTALELDR